MLVTQSILVLVFVCSPLFARANLTSQIATPGAAQFEAANKFYEERKYSEAADGYETISKNGAASPALWFNLGNAYFRSGQVGRAIVAYRRAEQSTPRDPDIKANLRFARNQVQGPTFHPPGWQRAIGGISLNEWSVFAAIGVWLTFLSLAAARLRPDLKPFWLPSAKIFGFLTLVQLAGLVASIAANLPELAVVTAREVVVRNGPLEESASSFTANDGAELRVVDRKDDWIQVTDGTRRIGWLKRSEASLLDRL